MDSKTYKEITGLENYIGFKSQLKTGEYTGKFRCDDDTIIFNRIVTFNQFVNTFYDLADNQVAVLLNATCIQNSFANSQFASYDVNRKPFNTEFINLINGILMIDLIILDSSYSGFPQTLTVAIFDLY